MAKLDHIMYATADLDKGIAEIAELTGVTAAIGGAHPGNGTRNALLSLGADQYLEIIAPDPQQDLSGTLGEELTKHGGSGVRAWAVAASDLSVVGATGRKYDLTPKPIIDMNRTTPEGVRLDWQICFLAGNNMLPFFIDWKDSSHPAQSTPKGCAMVDFTVSLPDAEGFKAFMEALSVEVSVVTGPESFTACIQTPSGLVELSNW
ncbi:MAG: VOC family protein [bacterium]|nr:VOC family protein [Gammaproteobacteria bacterium]